MFFSYSAEIIEDLEYFFDDVKIIKMDDQDMISAIFTNNKNKKIIINRVKLNWWNEKFEGAIYETMKSCEIVFTLSAVKAKIYYKILLPLARQL